MNPLLAAMQATIRDPAAGAAWLRSLRLPTLDAIGAALAVSAVTTLIGWATIALAPEVESASPWSMLQQHPLTMAMLQCAAILGGGLLMSSAGRAFGGRASFAESVLVIVWIEAILAVLQLVQMALMLLFPATATVLSLAVLLLFIYLLVRMTTAIHGFSNPLLVALGIVLTLMAAGSALSVLLAALGLLPGPPT